MHHTAKFNTLCTSKTIYFCNCCYKKTPQAYPILTFLHQLQHLQALKKCINKKGNSLQYMHNMHPQTQNMAILLCNLCKTIFFLKHLCHLWAKN
jgi:hypothetical protein